MSRIEELIKEKCPDGVEYRPIYEVTYWDKKFNGVEKFMQPKVIDYHKYFLGVEQKQLESPSGNIKILTTYYSEIYAKEEGIEDYITDSEIVCIPWGGNAIIQYYKGRFITGDNRIATSRDRSVLDNKYLYYVLCSQLNTIKKLYRGAGIQHPDMFKVLMLEIPVPPIVIQQEIVRILDKFTELESELQAELNARKKQYQYYLDDYFDSQTKNLQSLSEIGTLQRGKRFVHADAVENDGVACIHYGELYTYYGIYTNYARSRIREELRPKMRYAHKGDVIIVGAGENNIDIGVGVVWDGEEDVAVHDACYTLKHQQNPKYISYYLRSSFYHNQIKRFVSEGKICSISAEGIGRAIIPIPSMEEQNRVVKIFDNFDAISNDKILGLQAEIILRHKQYEYYRDLLLTFERTE